MKDDEIGKRFGVERSEGRNVQKRSSGGLKFTHGVALVAVGVLGVVIAFGVLHAVAGFVWGLVKFGIVVAVVLGLFWMLAGRRSSRT